jgi:hypothetical protein
MSLEIYCRWGSTVEFLCILKKYLKNWGSNVVGVLLSLEFYGQHPEYLYPLGYPTSLVYNKVPRLFGGVASVHSGISSSHSLRRRSLLELNGSHTI